MCAIFILEMLKVYLFIYLEVCADHCIYLCWLVLQKRYGLSFLKFTLQRQASYLVGTNREPTV
jgi:hypothetical protein